jgi:hypothetical protein
MAPVNYNAVHPIPLSCKGGGGSKPGQFPSGHAKHTCMTTRTENKIRSTVGGADEQPAHGASNFGYHLTVRAVIASMCHYLLARLCSGRGWRRLATADSCE